MSLYNILKAKKEHFMFEYFPPSDLSYGHNLSAIFEVLEDIENYFKEYSYNLNNEHFVDYLICYEWNKYNKDKKYILPEYSEQFNRFLRPINNVCKRFTLKDVLSFLENNNIVNTLSGRLKRIFYNFLKDNKNELNKEILKRNIVELDSYFLNDQDIWNKLLIKDGLYSYLLQDFDNLWKFNLENIMKFLVFLNEKEIDISCYIKKLNKIMDECLVADEKDSLIAKINYSTILAYYKKMKLPEANKYDIKSKIIDEKQQKWLEKNGHEINTDLQIEKVIKEIQKINHPGVQILYYTHEMLIENGEKEFYSFYEVAKKISQKNRPITYLLATNVNPETERFDNWLQECYAMIEILHLNILSFAFSNNEMKQNYLDGILVFMKEIVINFVNKEEIISETRKILTIIKNYMDSKDKSDLPYKDYCKSIVNYIEFLSRELYFELNKDKRYVDKESLTLGVLYDSDRNMLTDIFSEDFIDGIRYYLSSETNERGDKVGLDWRNKMNHANGMLDEKYNSTLFMRLCLIFTTIVNELYLHCISQQGQNK